MRYAPCFLLVFSLTLCLACSTTEQEPLSTPEPDSNTHDTTPTPDPPKMIQPGEATAELGRMRFSFDHDGEPEGSDPCEEVYDMCKALGPFPDSFAILQTTAGYAPGSPVGCQAPYRGPYGLYEFKTLAVVAGEAVPETLTVIAYAWQHGDPEPGDTILLPLYHAGQTWFSGSELLVQLNTDADQVDPAPCSIPVRVTLPETFEELVQEATHTFNNPAACDLSTDAIWSSNEDVERFFTTSGDPSCSNPEDAP